MFSFVLLDFIPLDMANSPFQELLHSTLGTGNPEVLKNWIEQEINTKDNNQETALHKASESGDLNNVNYYIQIGAQIDAKDKDGETPLHKAAHKGHFEVVQCLINQGYI